MADEPWKRNPKRALTRFVGMVLATAGFYAAGKWGWPGAYAVAVVFALACIGGLVDVVRAHRAEKDREFILDKAAEPSDRFTTRKSPPPARDGWQ